MKRLSIAFAVIALLLLGQSSPKRLTGKITHVSDGDTATILANNKEVIIRLDGIDAPEGNQTKGEESTKKLRELIMDKEVAVLYSEQDKYGRTIGRIYVGEVWVNLEMIKSGYAWHYKQYSKDETLAKAEEEARKEKIGIWADTNPMAPWEYRRLTRQRMNPLRHPPKPGEIVVYVTRFGDRYHKKNCQHARRRAIAVGLEFAKANYEPCSICNPPK